MTGILLVDIILIGAIVWWSFAAVVIVAHLFSK